MAVDWNKILTGVGDLSQVAGQTAYGRAQGQRDEALLGNSAAATDLARKRFALSAPSALASQAALGDILGNVGRLKLNVPGISTNVSGGLSPDLLKADPALASTARARMAALPQTLNTDTGYFTGNTQPQSNALDKILSGVGTFGSMAGAGKDILGGLGMLGKTAPGLFGAGAGGSVSLGAGATGGVSAPGAAGGGALGALGTIAPLAGAGFAIYSAIKAHQNATKGDRESFAKDAGFPNLATFNEYLSTLGPAGQQARAYGENVVGKHNKAQEQQWYQMVQQAMQQAGVK